MPHEPKHKPGCPALGGYGHGTEACACGANEPKVEGATMTEPTTIPPILVLSVALSEADLRALQGYVRASNDAAHAAGWREGIAAAWELVDARASRYSDPHGDGACIARAIAKEIAALQPQPRSTTDGGEG